MIVSPPEGIFGTAVASEWDWEGHYDSSITSDTCYKRESGKTIDVNWWWQVSDYN